MNYNTGKTEMVEITFRDVETKRTVTILVDNDPNDASLSIDYEPKLHPEEVNKNLYSALAVYFANDIITNLTESGNECELLHRAVHGS